MRRLSSALPGCRVTDGVLAANRKRADSLPLSVAVTSRCAGAVGAGHAGEGSIQQPAIACGGSRAGSTCRIVARQDVARRPAASRCARHRRCARTQQLGTCAAVAGGGTVQQAARREVLDERLHHQCMPEQCPSASSGPPRRRRSRRPLRHGQRKDAEISQLRPDRLAEAPVGDWMIALRCSMPYCCVSSRSSESLSWRCSSLSSKSMFCRPRRLMQPPVSATEEPVGLLEAEHHLGHDVALDLVGSGVDRRLSEVAVAQPEPAANLRLGVRRHRRCASPRRRRLPWPVR